MASFKRKFIDPVIVPVGTAIVTGALLIGLGETLLALHGPGEKDRIDRPELLFALGLSIVILLFFGYIASRPAGTNGFLDKEVVIGGKPFFDHAEHHHEEPSAKVGTPGAVSDIAEGYTLYAQSGALATVVGLVAGGSDHGKTFAGFIYARGIVGASSELWVPYEAVVSVYPESKSAFLSIKGDETETFGWNIPPESVRRGSSQL